MISRILITGASGFLGWNLCRSAVAKGLAVTGIYNSKTIKIAGADTIQCDLGDYASVKELIDKIRPDAVIHAAAMAVPDECQKNPVLSRKINVEASIGLAGICADRNISCVFTSTDLVFDGKKGRYSETSGTCPISLYGEQKLEAEAGMRERYPGVTICRMPLMFGDAPPAAKSFIQPIISALREGREVTLFTDEYRTPACALSAVSGIFIALEKRPGLLHLGGCEHISRYEIGVKLAKKLGIAEPKLKGVLQREVASPAPRPPDVSFDSSKAFALGYDPKPISEEFDRLECFL